MTSAMAVLRLPILRSSAHRALVAFCLGLTVCGQQIPPRTGPYKFIDPNVTMGCGGDRACDDEADRYLQAIGVYEPGPPGPGGNFTQTASRGSSRAWKASLGFSSDPTKPNPGELRAIYWNAGDLELGRDMHCIKH